MTNQRFIIELLLKQNSFIIIYIYRNSGYFKTLFNIILIIVELE